jgi:hypothetical protein
MGRRERRYLERAERALYEALAAGDARALAAATARLDAIEPRDEEDRRMRARLLAMAHTRVTHPVGARPARGDGSWMFGDPPPE